MLPLFRIEVISTETGELILARPGLCVFHQHEEMVEILPGAAVISERYGYPWGPVRYATKPDGYGECKLCTEYSAKHAPQRQRGPVKKTFISFSL